MPTFTYRNFKFDETRDVVAVIEVPVLTDIEFDLYVGLYLHPGTESVNA